MCLNKYIGAHLRKELDFEPYTNNTTTWTDIASFTIPSEYATEITCMLRVHAWCAGSGGLIRAYSSDGFYIPSNWGFGVLTTQWYYIPAIGSPGATVTLQGRSIDGVNTLNCDIIFLSATDCYVREIDDKVTW